MVKNKLIIAAAGSGKTTYLVDEALKIKDKKVLITTFTIENEREINKKFIEKNGWVPANIRVQTWFSFLIQHGVKPYQSLIYEGDIQGLCLVNQKSGRYCKRKDAKYYINSRNQIYSDKISDFSCYVDELSGGKVFKRLADVFSYIFIDEIQDLAGYDLEFVRQLLSSSACVIMVGDPRQTTYLTHNSPKYKKYARGNIENFIEEECKSASIVIDKESLNVSYRNNKEICFVANKLYPDMRACEHKNYQRTGHDGVFFVLQNDVEKYLQTYTPMQLRRSKDQKVHASYPVKNFGEAKGLSFDRVLIYPTKDMLKWFLNQKVELKIETKSKLYVALTRARYSVGIVCERIFEQGYQSLGINYFYSCSGGCDNTPFELE